MQSIVTLKTNEHSEYATEDLYSLETMKASADIIASAQNLEEIQIGDSESNNYYFEIRADFATGSVDVYSLDNQTTPKYSATTTKPVITL